MLASSFASRVLSINARDEWRKVRLRARARARVFVCMCVCACVCVHVRVRVVCICVCSATSETMSFSTYIAHFSSRQKTKPPSLIQFRKYTTHTRKYTPALKFFQYFYVDQCFEVVFFLRILLVASF